MSLIIVAIVAGCLVGASLAFRFTLLEEEYGDQQRAEARQNWDHGAIHKKRHPIFRHRNYP